jgi:hypothetical protein
MTKPARQRAGETRFEFWRSQMRESYLERKGYGSRWAVELFFSGLKRTTRINADLTQTQSAAGGSRVQSAGLHPPALAKPIEFRMISTEQQVNRICGLVSF